MSSHQNAHPQTDQSELLGAALRYGAVADWFESHPCIWRKRMTVAQAMAVFHQAEAELRAAGAQALRQPGQRQLLLQAAGVPEAAR